MYRRIVVEPNLSFVIFDMADDIEHEYDWQIYWNVTEIWDVFPETPIGPVRKHWFTEFGWEQVGKEIKYLFDLIGIPYQFLQVDENAIDIIYRDRYQVVADRRQ